MLPSVRVCTVCSAEFVESEFRWKNKTRGIRISMCRACDKAYRSSRYREHRDKILAANKRSEQRRKDLVATNGVTDPKKRRCIDCLEVLPATQFRLKNKATMRRISRCQECDKAWRSDYYQGNKDLFLENNKRQYKKLRGIVDRKKNVPCEDCGRSFPSFAMDFDHRDPSSKIDKVSALVYRGSERLVLDEIAKCDVVCAVCHRIRTFGDSK